MIKTKRELQFYLMADRMMNRGEFTPSLKSRIKNFLTPDYVMNWLVAMRHVAYYKHLLGGISCCTLNGCVDIRNCR